MALKRKLSQTVKPQGDGKLLRSGIADIPVKTERLSKIISKQNVIR